MALHFDPSCILALTIVPKEPMTVEGAGSTAFPKGSFDGPAF